MNKPLRISMTSSIRMPAALASLITQNKLPGCYSLKYLDDLEQEKSLEAELEDKDYSFIIDLSYQWSAWAAPKDSSGNFDHNNALTGDDLMDYVDGELFPLSQVLQREEPRAQIPSSTR